MSASPVAQDQLEPPRYKCHLEIHALVAKELTGGRRLQSHDSRAGPELSCRDAARRRLEKPVSVSLGPSVPGIADSPRQRGLA